MILLTSWTGKAKKCQSVPSNSRKGTVREVMLQDGGDLKVLVPRLPVVSTAVRITRHTGLSLKFLHVYPQDLFGSR